LTEARDRTINQPRVDLLQGRVVESIGGEPTDLEVFDEHVRAARQSLHDTLAFRRREIDRHGFLVAVGTEVVSRVGVFIGGGVTQKWRSPAACVVAASGPFDLDDLRAEIAEHLSRPGSGEYAR
jgi:hypothetical protein